MNKRFFTVKEVNELIPFLTERLDQLCTVHKEIRTSFSERTPSLQKVLSLGGIPVDYRYFTQLSKLQSLVTEICSEGCQIKDIDDGLVDFPTIWEGREVCLCWKLGEAEVAFWHEVDAGFAGRQPLRTSPRS